MKSSLVGLPEVGLFESINLFCKNVRKTLSAVEWLQGEFFDKILQTSKHPRPLIYWMVR